MSERSESSGGGGDRTRMLPSSAHGNNQLIQHNNDELAALWLQLSDVDKHEMTRLAIILNVWPSLPNHVKKTIETLCGIGVIEAKVTS